MRFPYLNKTQDAPVRRSDGTIYAYQWTSWRLTARGSVIYRVVRRYLCGHCHETFRVVPSSTALASDIEHRNAMMVVLAREAAAAPFDRRHMFRPHCARVCGRLERHEPAALAPIPRRKPRPPMQQVVFAWAASA